MDFENNPLDVITFPNASNYAGGGGGDCYKELEENGKMDVLQWSTAMLGATAFVLFSKVTLLLNPIMGKPWYTDLMTYLIALAMGTMLCVTVFQLIPESLDLMAEKKYPIKCGDYKNVQKTLFYDHKSVIVDDCDQVCPGSPGGRAGGNLEDKFCTLTIGGTQQFIPVVCVLYLCTIIFYDLQKFLQIAFSNEDGTHLAELDNPEDMLEDNDEDILIQMRKYGNRQQSISVAAKMANIPTAFSVDKIDGGGSDIPTTRKRVPSQANILLAQRRASQTSSSTDVRNLVSPISGLSNTIVQACTYVKRRSSAHRHLIPRNRWRRLVVMNSAARHLSERSSIRKSRSRISMCSGVSTSSMSRLASIHLSNTDHTHSHHNLTSAAAPIAPHGRPTPPSVQNRCSTMCGHQHLAPVQNCNNSGFFPKSELSNHASHNSTHTLPSVSTPQLLSSSSRQESPSINSIDSMIHSTDLESADLTPPYLQMSTNRAQMHRAPICSPENCSFPVESTNSSSGKASIYQANLKYLADQSNLQLQNQNQNDGQLANGTITEENVTEVDVDKYVSIENEKTPKKSKVKFGAVTEIENEGFSSDGETSGDEKKSVAKSKDESTSGDGDFEKDGEHYAKLKQRRNTGVPLVNLPVEDDDEKTSGSSKSEKKSSHDSHHGKQEWHKVDMVAWILLLCISIECLIEGIAFALTLTDELGAGIAILTAMIIKLIPQKLGDAVILSKAGLNHFWENLLSLGAVSFVYVGVILGMLLKPALEHSEEYFFGALAGIFLYISLSSLFPVLHDIIDDPEVIGSFDDPAAQAKAFRNQQFRRLLLANFGFFTAMGLMVPLIWFEHDLQEAITELICNSL